MDITLNLPQLNQPDIAKGLIERFLAAQDIKPISREGYRRRLKQFFLYLDREKPSLNKEAIVAYKRSLQERKFSPISIGGYLVAVRMFFSWCESAGVCKNFAKTIKSPKRPNGFRRDPLTVPQVQYLLASIDKSTLKGARDFALLNLLVRTAIRTIELVRADVGDIRQESGETVLYLQGKGADTKDAMVVLTESALRPLQEYFAMRGPLKTDEPLFGSTSDSNRHQRMTTRSIRRIVKVRMRGIQLDSPRLSAHSCRHTAITMALIAGASIQETKEMARHADVNTTLIYAQNLKRAAGVPEKKIDELLKAEADYFFG